MQIGNQDTQLPVNVNEQINLLETFQNDLVKSPNHSNHSSKKKLSDLSNNKEDSSESELVVLDVDGDTETFHKLS